MAKIKKRRFEVDPEKFFFIYDTNGEWHATILQNAIWDLRGDYIGWIEDEVKDEREQYAVYKKDGEYVGELYRDGRIVRRRNNFRRELIPPGERPEIPPRPKLPPRAPLAPLPGDLGFSLIDVLDWDDETFKKLSDLRPDMD